MFQSKNQTESFFSIFQESSRVCLRRESTIQSRYSTASAEQICLLKACIFSDQNAWKGWLARIDFDQIDQASYKLLPLVSRNREFNSMNSPIFERCKGVYRRTWTENQVAWNKLLPILINLKSFGVEKIVLLKGMAMILQHYQDFGARVIGDVDVFIERDCLHLADAFLQANGWKAKCPHFDLNNPEHLNNWHALNYIHSSGLNLDLHWSFIEENRQILDQAVMGDSILLSNGLYVPNPTDLLIQTCLHGMKYSPVPLIRWIADAMTLLQKSMIDWNRLTDLAARAQICAPLYQALNYLNSEFGAKIPEKTLLNLKHHQTNKLQQLEYRFHKKGNHVMAGWYRFCLNRAYLTKWAQFLHIHQYLQLVARLKSPWQIPFFAIYWVYKRLRARCLGP